MPEKVVGTPTVYQMPQSFPFNNSRWARDWKAAILELLSISFSATRCHGLRIYWTLIEERYEVTGRPQPD